MKDFLINNFEIILPYLFGAGGLFTAWTERKKRKQEIQQAETQNQQQVVDLYQEALDDLKKRYDEKFKELDVDLKQLRHNLDLWKGKYRILKKEFDEYRESHEKSNN